MFLRDCKEAIDAGRTAKLIILPENPATTIEITIRIKKKDAYYWQHTLTSAPGMEPIRPNTAAFPNWEVMLRKIEGTQTETSAWILCDDELEPIPVLRRFLEDGKMTRVNMPEFGS